MRSVSAKVISLKFLFYCSWQREADPLRLHWYSLELAGPESIFVFHPFINVPSDTSQLLKLLWLLLSLSHISASYLYCTKSCIIGIARSGYGQDFCVFMLSVCALAY